MVLENKKDAKLIGLINDDSSYFTINSIVHYLAGILGYYIFRVIFKTNNINAILLANIIHIIEEYLENTSIFSIEGILAKICNCRNNLFLDYMDHDSLQNSMGDNICAFLGTLTGSYLYNKKYRISSNSIYKIIVITAIIYCILCHMVRNTFIKKGIW